MNTRGRLIVGLVIATALLGRNAAGEGAKLLFFPVGAPEGIKVVPPGGYTPAGGQHLIPRFSAGGSNPAGALLGWGGKRSPVVGTLTTGNAPIVATQHWDEDLNMWANGTQYALSVMGGLVKDVVVMGPDTQGNGYSTDGLVGSTPATTKKIVGDITGATNASPVVITSVTHTLATGASVEIAGVLGNTAANGTFTITVLDANTFSLNSSTGNGDYVSGGGWKSSFHPNLWQGVFIKSTGGRAENVETFYIPGTGLTMARGAGTGGGAVWWYDDVNNLVRDYTSTRCYRGLDFRVTDGIIDGRTIIGGVRDYGALITGSAVQQSGNVHVAGCTSGAPITAPSPCWWLFSADSYDGRNLYLETGDVGLRVTNCRNCRFQGLKFHTCAHSYIIVEPGAQLSTGNTFRDVEITTRVGGATPSGGGIRVASGFNRFLGGVANLNNSAALFQVTDGRRLVVRDWYVFADNNTKVVNCTGSTGTLDNSVIELHVDALNSGANGIVAVDLKEDNGTSRLGANNTITITGGAGVWSAPETYVDLPDEWDDESNVITVDGVRLTNEE